MALTGAARDRAIRALADLGVPQDLVGDDTTLDALADECVLYPYLLLAAAERYAVEPLPEDLVEASSCVGDLLHYAEVRHDQQSSTR